MSGHMIQTVTGPITPDQLGPTLMHEHLVIGFPGWESDGLRPGPTREERLAICIDKLEEMKALGFRSMLDPCPNDLGRDVVLMAEAAARTGFQIICATGLYKHAEGGQAYWQTMGQFGGYEDALVELLVRELTIGIGDTGIRAGLIKVATGDGAMTDHEHTVFRAAARASVETGALITTHTDHGKLGDEQQRILTGLGVPAHRIIIGHSCGSSDTQYHMAIARGGSYLGFDRFGAEFIIPDDTRIACLIELINQGAGDRIVISHDSVWCFRGEPVPPALLAQFTESWNPSHFSRRIIPRLLAAGVSQAQIDGLLIDNPRRFFAHGNLNEIA